ncbi:MAG: hydantoinase B/oxoprolinase family protein [Rhizomicrobium sp.]
MSTLKLLSESSRYDDAALEGIRRALGLASGAAIPPGLVGEVRMGTTVATNALLTRTGERVVLVTTRGLKDQLRIGYQNRPKLFALKIELPDMLYESVIEAEERVGAGGETIVALDEAALARDLAAARAQGIAACAIVFLHGYRFPRHEARAAQIAAAAGFTQVSTSHEAVPLMKFVSRGRHHGGGCVSLAGAGALYAADRGRLGRGAAVVHDVEWRAGGARGSSAAKDAIVSGPAGGVVGMAETAREAGFEHVIGFDMGGPRPTWRASTAPMTASMRPKLPACACAPRCWRSTPWRQGAARSCRSTGRASAPDRSRRGARPGPMSYRGGGPLTVTDANVMVGKLRGAFFPKIFGANGDAALDEEAVGAAFAALATRVGKPAEAVADGFIRVAVENMANAIKRISVAKGYDARDYALACFGGAGGQHACLVADALGMTTVFLHGLSSLLSAYGMKLAALRSHRQRAVGKPLRESEALLTRAERDLRRAAEDELVAQGATLLAATARVHVRYDGSDTTLPVLLGAPDEMAEAFNRGPRAAFRVRVRGARADCGVGGGGGQGRAGAPFLPPLLRGRGTAKRWRGADGARSTALAPSVSPVRDGRATSPVTTGEESRSVRFFSQGAWHDAAVYRSGTFTSADGPALIVEPHQTIVVEAGWRAERVADGVVLRRQSPHPNALRAFDLPATGRATDDVDPVLLEVFANLFMGIAEEMGAVLQNTATSVNIKERLDFSCAVFDAAGGLVANAPHMPVHLGSMGDCVSAIMAKHPHMQDGDAFVTNAPYDGGTHLPDVTVVMPVFVDGALAFYVASRGHHADIGGITPGSMPAVLQGHRRGRRAVRRDTDGACRALRRGGGARGAGAGAVAGAQSGAEPCGFAGTGGGLRPRCRGIAQRLRRAWHRRRHRLHAACAGQCRGIGAPGDRAAEGRQLRAGDGQRRHDQDSG